MQAHNLSTYHPVAVPVSTSPALTYGREAQTLATASAANVESEQSNSNQLVRIVTPLIALITQIRYTASHPNVAALRAQVIEEIKLVERKLSDACYAVRTIIATRYCLCTAIDEAILSQDWGSKSVWIAGSLLSLFQKETWGGERFYIILEDALRDTRNNIDFIEFIYFLISLGFEGRYYGEGSRATREEIRNRIFYHIRHARLKPERNLSPHAKQITAPVQQRHRRVMIKKLFIITATLLLGLVIFYNLKVYHAAAPTLQQLNKLATVDPNIVFGQVIPRALIARDAAGDE